MILHYGNNVISSIGIGHKSGGAFTGIIKIDVKMSKSKQIYGSSYVELPKFIKNKKACVNIKNVLSCKKDVTIYDNKCFLWSLVASKHYDDVKKIECRYYKQFLSSIKIPDNVVYPVPIDDITLWEQCNNMKINVLMLLKTIKNIYYHKLLHLFYKIKHF